MLVGIVGAPNKGKSTLFNTLTMANAAVADYPFTTIKPNFGVAYVTKECADRGLGVRCSPRSSGCSNGIRQIPVNITDVAGLVPGAHIGKGMGNQFLSDLAAADALIQVVDLSGSTDMQGNGCEGCRPEAEVAEVQKEIALWLAGIIKKHIGSISKRDDGDVALRELLTGFNAGEEKIRAAAESGFLSTSHISWNDDEIYSFAAGLLKISKPVIVAANKLDKSGAGALEELRERLKGHTVIGCSAAIELALRKAAESGTIEYVPGAADFKIVKGTTQEQARALEYMSDFIKRNDGTGVQQVLNSAVFGALRCIVVYPVEDENKYTDHFGNVLPDALLVEKGTTAMGLAAKIHTELARGMLYAIDARKKMKVAKDYELKDGDVIRIVSAAR